VQKYSFKVPFKVPQIRPLADIVHFEIFTYLLTYLLTYKQLQSYRWWQNSMKLQRQTRIYIDHQ